MDDEIVNKIIELKVDMVLSSTKYSISGTGEQNDRTVLDSVVLSWIEPLQNAMDLKQKYDSFIQMDNIIKRSLLFDYVQSISEDKNHAIVRHAIGIYHGLLENSDYQYLVPRCGYQLSDEFGVEDFYLDGTLLKKVNFYCSFRDKIHTIYDDLLKKGVFSR